MTQKKNQKVKKVNDMNKVIEDEQLDVKKLVGARIREYRQKCSKSQEQFAEMIGIDGKHLSNIELGKNMPNPQLLLRISNILDIEIKDLFEFYHHMPAKNIRKQIIELVENLNDEQLKNIYKYIRALVC